MRLEQFKKRANKIPDTPGVYFFLNKTKKVLYIGKATSLRSRMRSYFASDLHETRGALIVNMIAEAHALDWRETDSVLEALILEANLIHAYKPAANTDLKDDKSFNYVVITKEDFPRILVVRGKDLGQGDSFRRSWGPVHLSGEKNLPAPLHTFGPFPHGMQLKAAMKIIRKIFPYRDTCTPGVGKPCFNRQIGLCPGVCSGDITKQEYRKIIRRVALFFQGKKKELLKSLTRDMNYAAKDENFELAKKLRQQMFALQHIQDVSLIKDEYRHPRVPTRVGNMRLEAYDAAHFGGSSNVGVMVVVEDGDAQKREYRKFRIRSANPGDDTGALKEILTRRLGHDEWPMPRLIVVDGGTAQVNAATRVFEHYGVGIPVVGVVKDEKHRPRNILGNAALIKGFERDILLANAEAHRFAIGYHRKRRHRGLLQ